MVEWIHADVADLVEQEADHFDVARLRRKVERGVALVVGTVVVNVGDVLKELQHLDLAVATQMAHGGLKSRKEKKRGWVRLWS